ncbi:hypothetical protein [Fundidesulfovibrio agrisoli]|uniref:hypothetical protein n=1 Tax=Fundidesulfovibrio agrisoli TaxID=2922717 RepID=UPI001FAD188D|nr:hypothetical protein [Fundidesulfovibrio agrisoli]
MAAFISPIVNRALCATLLALLLCGVCHAQAELEMQVVSKDATLVAVVGEEDGEGLWVVTNDGTSYSVWTPEDVSLEAVSAFQQTYKNKEVTLVGDIYKDKFGNLNLFVKSLPK